MKTVTPPIRAAHELLLRHSREFSFICNAAGELQHLDERSERLLRARPGDRLHALCAAGSEDGLARFLQRASSASVTGWELNLVVADRPRPVVLCAEPLDGLIAVLAGLMPEGYRESLASAGEAMVEIVGLNRQLSHQKSELARLNNELTASSQGILTLHDELAERAQAAASDAAVKNRLVANVSHEFRTPINAIIGLTRLLDGEVDGPLTDEQRRQVRYIEGAAQELDSLVADMLDLSQLGAGAAGLRVQTFSVSSFLQSVAGMLRPTLPTDGSMELDITLEGPDLELHTDKAKLSQIVRNLLTNAIKFTGRGRVAFTARTDADCVRFSVTDDGPGIAPEYHNAIFEEFFRVETTARNVQGTGLGLPLAQRLTRLLGGELAVESALGAGATFSFTIPAVHDEVCRLAELEAAADEDDGREPVLVVEDDRKSILVYERYLTKAGFKVIPARTISDARRHLELRRPAAIVLDVILEGETSWQFLADLKDDPRTASIPVLVVTISASVEQARALGADEFWLKPIDPDRLLRKLHQVKSTRDHATVLIIDDEERSRYLIRRMLQDSPFKVLEAETGEQGVKLAREVHPECVLLDFLLEHMTAFDVIDQLKADPNTRHIPIIVSTAYELNPKERARLSEIAVDVWSKGALSRELAIQRIRDALQTTLRPSSLTEGQS